MKLSYYAFLTAERVVARVPIRLMRAAAHAGGDLYYYLFAGKRRQVRRNMRRALGSTAPEREVSRVARHACRYYADYWVDILWLPTRSRQYILDRFGRVGEEYLLKVVRAGKGVVVVLPHYGSWEAGAVFLSSLGPFAAVAEVVNPPELFDLFVKLRKEVGIEIFPYDHRPETRGRMIESLKQGTMLALLSDRDLKGTGVEVEFFGERTTMPPGPVTLAMKAGSPILCVSVRNLDDGTWVGHATEPIYLDADDQGEEVLRETMQLVACRLEELIREDPAQWHMFMPAWPSDR